MPEIPATQVFDAALPEAVQKLAKVFLTAMRKINDHLGIFGKEKETDPLQTIKLSSKFDTEE